MNKSDLTRDYLMLGKHNKKGYDWWWHSFTGISEKTGKEKPFYIEFYITNPGLNTPKPQFGQSSQRPSKPCYVMMNVGTWGENPRQLHNFYPISDLKTKSNELSLTFGGNSLSETKTKGKVEISKLDAKNHPEYMSDAGSMSWNLTIDKQIAFNVGYGANKAFRDLNSFEMFWHAEGMKTQYSGEVILDREKYIVSPETSYGYADKNWGKDFTSPWLWIATSDIYSQTQQKQLNNSALDIGGGCPKAFGVPFNKKLLAQFTYEGKDLEFNFSKLLSGTRNAFTFSEKDKEKITWNIVLKNKEYELVCIVSCNKKETLFINYEAPNGKKLHTHLWNGGNATGTLVLHKIDKHKNVTILDVMTFKHGGCEYGEYNK